MALKRKREVIKMEKKKHIRKKGQVSKNKDFEIENERLYTSFETARICNVGRTTLIRIEEKGFDNPRMVDEKTGNRYYDVVNINRILQYQMFHKLGLNTSEIIDYYNGDLDEELFIFTLRDRVAVAQRCLDEFESRFTERESLSFSYVTLPESTYYCFTCDIELPKEQIRHNYLELQRMYDLGFKPFPTTPMASVVPDFNSIYNGENPSPFHSLICVAVYPDQLPDPQKTIAGA